MNDVRLPNFLIVGAMKCGTSTLCDVLRAHPDVFIATLKEPHFFSSDKKFKLGMEWYLSHFQGSQSAAAVGEASTTYSIAEQYPHTIGRVMESLGDVRVIYMVRHPLKRMESEYRTRKRLGRHACDDFTDAVRRFPLVDTSMYWRQVSHWKSHIDPKRIHVMFLEDYVEEPETEVRKLLQFLEIDDGVDLSDLNRPRNSASNWTAHTPVSRTLRRVLGGRKLSQQMPSILQQAYKKYLKKPAFSAEELDLRWDAELKREVIAKIAPDAARFLQEYGKPSDFWEEL